MIDEMALREAGRIAAAVRARAVHLASPGARLSDLCAALESEIRRMGGYLAFPVQASRNEIAAHSCPPPHDPTVCATGDLLKVDLGVHIEGWIVDTAVTVAVDAPPGAQELVAAAQAALEAAVRLAEPFVPIARLSAAIESAITQRGFRPMRNLCGHHLGRWSVHCPPPIPNFPDESRSTLVPGAIFAIEPFATTGAGIAVERGRAEVFRLCEVPASADGIDGRLLDLVVGRHGMPFSRRDLAAIPEEVVEAGLLSLLTRGLLASYPPLVEMTGRPVAQAEHTLLVRDRDVVVLTA